MNPFEQPNIDGDSEEMLSNRHVHVLMAIDYWNDRLNGIVPWWDPRKEIESKEFIQKNIEFFTVQRQRIEQRLKKFKRQIPERVYGNGGCIP